MRLKIKLAGKTGELALPLHYNQTIQGFIYRHLKAEIASKLHEEGFLDSQSSRCLRFFTFSRLCGRWQRKADQIVFSGPIVLTVASPWTEFISSLATHFLRENAFQINGQEVLLEEVSVEREPEYTRPVLVKTLSPITIYSTLAGPAGKKTYYYSPFEREFSAFIVKNLARKARVWYGKEVEAEGRIRPVRVSKRNEHVLTYKGTVIKAWSGIYELDLAEELFRMAIDAGLGAKNSQGFGCIEVWKFRGGCHVPKERKGGPVNA